MTQPILESQSEPAHIRRARAALAAVLVGEPDLDACLAVGGALALLGDVHPPYPLLPNPVEPLAVADGVAVALAELAHAIEAASGAQGAITAGLAARELRDLRGQP